MSSGEIIIDNKLMEYRKVFEKISRVDIKDLIENDDLVIFIVNEHRMAEMFRKNKNVVAELREKVKKSILIAEYSTDLITYVRNIFFRYKVNEIHVTWRETGMDVQVSVDPAEIGKAIGKDGKNIKMIRDLVARSYNVKTMGVKLPQ
ncbi:NusA-like transcription termination signal-binding factor [Caldiplasma sukawensis]